MGTFNAMLSAYPEIGYGMEAYWLGFDNDNCPYAPDTVERNNWLSGWQYAYWEECGPTEPDVDI